MDRQISVLKDIIRNPSHAFHEISRSRNAFVPGAAFIFILSVILRELSKFTFIDVVSSVVRILLEVTVLYAVCKLFKGTATFSELFSVLGYAMIPVIIASCLILVSNATIPHDAQTAMSGMTARLTALESQKNITVAEHEQQRVALMNDFLSQLTTPSILIPLIFVVLVIFATSIWRLILLVIAVTEVNIFSTGKAIGIVILNAVVYAIIALILSLVTGLHL